MSAASRAPSALTRRGRLVFRLAAGQEVEHITTHRDVRTGVNTPATAVDRGGSVDSVIRRHSAAMIVTRAFGARRGLACPGQGHLHYDDMERALGLSRTFRLAVDPDADVTALVDDLAGIEGVEMASPEILCVTPFSSPPDRSEARWDAHRHFAQEMIGASEALAIEPGDSALIVGLVDSGVTSSHPELRGRLRPGISSVALSRGEIGDGVTILGERRTQLQNVEDDEGHGTACAGIIGANGLRIPRGLAGAARLLPIRALCGARLPGRSKPTAVGSLQDIDSGLKTAIDLGARVLNLSFGTPASALRRDDPPPHVDIVRYALAHGCVLVAASGNAGTTVPYFPAALPGVFAVSSVSAARRPSMFTSRGPHVALSAPGEEVESATLDGYRLESGTSFAAPFVAAACALLLSRAARFSTPLTNAAVHELLVRSASPFAAGADADGCGAGILDVPAALRAFDEACNSTADGRAA